MSQDSIENKSEEDLQPADKGYIHKVLVNVFYFYLYYLQPALSDSKFSVAIQDFKTLVNTTSAQLLIAYALFIVIGRNVFFSQYDVDFK